MFRNRYAKFGMAVAMMGMMGAGQAQSDYNRMINEIAPQPGNNSGYARSRSRSLELMYLTPNGSQHKVANWAAKPGSTAQNMVNGYDFARPYLQELGAPYTEETGIQALQSKDTREQCAATVHWNADMNNMNAFTSMVVRDNPSANPQGYSNAYNDYMTLNCNW